MRLHPCVRCNAVSSALLEPNEKNTAQSKSFVLPVSFIPVPGPPCLEHHCAGQAPHLVPSPLSQSHHKVIMPFLHTTFSHSGAICFILAQPGPHAYTWASLINQMRQGWLKKTFFGFEITHGWSKQQNVRPLACVCLAPLHI